MKLAEVIACGECLSWAMKTAMMDKSVDVLYAMVHDPWDGKKFAHAWVEKGNKAMDWQTMEAGLSKYAGKGWPKKEFYKAYKPKNIKKYTAKEAVANRKKYGSIMGWDWPS